MRPLPILLLMLTASCLVATEDKADAALPAAARTALARYETAVGKIKETADQATAKEQDRIAADLNKLLTSETRKGNLESALAIKARLDGINAAIAARSDLLGNLVITDALLMGRTFAFGVIEPKQVFTTLTMGKGGKLIGSLHDNETGWVTVDGQLDFKHADGRTSSVFDAATMVDGKLHLTGIYKLAQPIRLELREK